MTVTSGATVPVPQDLAEATSPGWLERALQACHPGVAVTGVELRDLDARVSTNAALRVSTEGHGTLDLYVKGYFGDVGIGAAYLGAVEACFYAELAPQLTGVRTLVPLHAGADLEALRGVVVTEDLTADGGRLLSPDPATPDQVADGLTQLASLHAATWQAPAWADTWWLAPRRASLEESRGEVIEPNLAKDLADGVPYAVRDAGLLRRAARDVVRDADAASAWSVLHGDPHPGNCFVTGTGGLGLFDWQLVQRGPWYLDVGYHLAATLAVADRRAHEQDLLVHYLDRLAAGGAPAPGIDEARRLVRDGIVYGYLLWAITLQVAPPVIAELLTRLGTAADDHDALDRSGTQGR